MGKLANLILRRDRIRIPVWIFSIAVMSLIIAPSFTELYPTPQDRMVMAETMKNPAMIAMVGPGYGLDNYTLGAMFAQEMLVFTAVAVAIMSIFIVVRHTRKDEENGRIEVIRSLPVGRLSNLSAAITVSFGANVLLALLTGFGLYALGIESMDLQGSLLYGAALGATGFIFTGIAAVFAQLSETSRGATGYSFAFLIITYLIRAIGDVSSEVIAWFSPLGWILRTQVYVNNYWWPILITVGASFALAALALYLNSRRDLEAGFIPAKPGRKYASAFLKSPLGLAVRLQKTAILSWIIGVYILGASYGSVLGDLESFFETNEMMSLLLPTAEGYSLTELFIGTIMSVMAMICAVPVLQFLLKARGEEKRNRTENLLSRAVSRTHLLGSYVFISVISSAILQLLAIVGLWSAGAAVMDEPIAFDRMLQTGMVYLPALWIMIGITVFLIGVLPKTVSCIWLYLGFSFFVVYLGGILQVPDWLVKASPFGNIPQLPVEEVNVVKMVILTLIALLLTVIGFYGYKKRDIQA
jgi:ABC-2 type transport system permease protein